MNINAVHYSHLFINNDGMGHSFIAVCNQDGRLAGNQIHITSMC